MTTPFVQHLRDELLAALPVYRRRRRRRVAAVAAAASVTAGALVTVGVLTRDRHDEITVTGSSSTVSGPSASATTAPAEASSASGLVVIEGTTVQVPVRVDGFEPPTQQDRSTPATAARPPGVTYHRASTDGVPGDPGSLSVSVVAVDPATLDLLEHATDDTATAFARDWYAREVGDVQVHSVGTRVVVEVRATEVMPGGDVGYPDRVYDDYLFAAPDQSAMVLVITDSLTSAEALDFIRRIEV